MRARRGYLCLVLVIALSLVITGCGKVAEKAAEKATEKAIEDSSGGKAKVDLSGDKLEIKTDEGSFKVGGTYEWPSQIPADVPKFTEGNIVSVMENTTPDGKSVFVGIENVKIDVFDKYKSELEGSGWSISMTSKSETGFLISAQKEKKNVSISFSGSSDGGYSGGVTYVEEKE